MKIYNACFFHDMHLVFWVTTGKLWNYMTPRTVNKSQLFWPCLLNRWWGTFVGGNISVAIKCLGWNELQKWLRNGRWVGKSCFQMSWGCILTLCLFVLCLFNYSKGWCNMGIGRLETEYPLVYRTHSIDKKKVWRRN